MALLRQCLMEVRAAAEARASQSTRRAGVSSQPVGTPSQRDEAFYTCRPDTRSLRPHALNRTN